MKMCPSIQRFAKFKIQKKKEQLCLKEAASLVASCVWEKPQPNHLSSPWINYSGDCVVS